MASSRTASGPVPGDSTGVIPVANEPPSDTVAHDQVSLALDHAGTVKSNDPAQDQSVFINDTQLDHVASAPYSVFSVTTRRWVVFMITIGSIISPMTANIYFPAIVSISKDLNVSLSLINLSLTTYMIFQGLSPPIFGDFGDMAGRRPAYIVSLTMYTIVNIALALQRNYAALLVLRCLQSAGSSGTLALGYAVVADLVPRSDRGRYMGIIGAGINVGPTLGPFLGGLLSQFLGWPALFWFLAIFAFAWLVPWILFVPETCRNVVGNGSAAPQSWNYPVIQYLVKRRQSTEAEPGTTRKLRIPNPLKTLALSFEKEMGQILIIATAIYLDFILVAATLSPLFKKIYGFSDLQIGLCYLPYGVGCCITSILQGYVLDWNYRRIAKKVGFGMVQKSKEEMLKFPIESARMQPLYPTLAVGSAAVIAYGWALHMQTTVAVPLVMLFIIGMTVPTSFNALTTLIVDIFPEAPATAAAANNLVRCLFGAIATSVIDFMLQGMGIGGCFTFLASLMIISIPWLWVIQSRGPRWRAEKEKAIELKELNKSQAANQAK